MSKFVVTIFPNGGAVIREWRSDYSQGQLTREASACQAELALLDAERAGAKAESQARLNELAEHGLE